MRLTTAIVIANTELRPGVHLIEIREPYLARSAQPGQYCMVRCCESSASDPLLRRPFFIHGVSRTREQCSLLVAARGRGTAWLLKQAVGATLDIMGPLGHGWQVSPATRNLLLLGKETTISALTLLAQTAVEQELGVTLLCQFSRESAVYPPSLLSPEIEYHVVLAAGERRDTIIVDLVGDYLSWADAVYCGVSGATLLALAQRYEALRRLHFTQGLVLRPFACGYGVCLTCALETNAGSRLVCRDGPVFQLGEIL